MLLGIVRRCGGDDAPQTKKPGARRLLASTGSTSDVHGAASAVREGLNPSLF